MQRHRHLGALSRCSGVCPWCDSPLNGPVSFFSTALCASSQALCGLSQQQLKVHMGRGGHIIVRKQQPAPSKHHRAALQGTTGGGLMREHFGSSWGGRERTHSRPLPTTEGAAARGDPASQPACWHAWGPWAT